jgi:uncharacterized coiled-coil DUF342 family protein
MKKNRTYIKHQAFNTAHKELIDDSENLKDGFNRARKYHHSPEKLRNFSSYIGYLIWSNELYISSTKLINLLQKIYDKAENAKSAWHENKNNLNDILDEYDQLKSSLSDLYCDISELQNCILATDINEKQAQIEILSDQVRRLGALENKIIETSNRKLYEISSSRVTYANLSIALTALIVSVLSVLYF